MTGMMTAGQKAAATRLKNKLRAKYQQRAYKAWETRRANAIEAGLLDADGNPTPEEIKNRRKLALKVWRKRRKAKAAAVIAAMTPVDQGVTKLR